MHKKVHVIAHTHWDYEWYFTNSESFVQLCYHVDEVIHALEEGYLDYYMLDGQTCIVEDYLGANPDKRTRFKALVESGKLKIGPWYTQSDQMIVRGESLVRNLQIGMEIGNSAGGADMLGYIPDAFGQSIDMPKIFGQMGIDRAVFWRGLSSNEAKQREFFWESEDGSSVLAYNIKDGYFVGVQLIENDDCNPLLRQIKKDTVSSHIGLPVGGDQRYVDFNLKDRINHYNNNLSEEVLFESNYDKLFEGIQNEQSNLPTVKGELLHAEVSKIHRSIYSSRYDHKYLNDKVERRLINQVEPLMAIADRLGIPYKKELLDKVWKIVLRNHAHDSAGGCNSDKTNQDILHRFIEADQLSYSLIDYLTRKISESRENVRDNQITLFNTLPFHTKKIMTMSISSDELGFSIYHRGKKIPYQVKNVNEVSNDQIRKDKDPAANSYYKEVEIVLAVELDPLGYEVLDIVNDQNEQVRTNEVVTVHNTDDASIENENYELIFSKGKFNLLDKKADRLYENFLYLEDSGDDGDNYDYSPPIEDKVIQLDFESADVRVVHGEIDNSIILSGMFHVPSNQSDRTKGQCSSTIPYECKLSLKKEKRSVDIQLDLKNQAFDHRMRMVINGDINTTESIADSPFGSISRPVVDPHLQSWRDKGWKEEPTGIYPMLSFVNVHDETKSVTAFSKGVKEYEIIGEKSKGIALTLFRSVGYLGKPDLLRRPGVASGNQFRYIATPDSQLQKYMTFKFSLIVEEYFDEAESFRHYRDYAVSVPYYQQQTLNQFTTPLKYFVMQPLFEGLPDTFSLLDASKVSNVVLSSVKMSRDGKGVVIRFFNPSSRDVQESGEVLCNQKIIDWHFVKMDENKQIGETHETQHIHLGRFEPKEIKSIYIRFQ